MIIRAARRSFGALLLVSFSLSVLALCGPASAQTVSIEPSQSELAKKPVAEQSTILAGVISGSLKGRSCANPSVSLEKTYDDHGGGWLVSCDDGQDYWAVVSDQAKSPAVALPCNLARQAETDCYANIHTVQPADIKQCAPSSGSLDRVIRSCTAIIQSHKFDDKPAVLHAAHVFRGAAFGGYQQFDLAVADFDKAVELQPSNLDVRYNRAVALEREGQFDQALTDLDAFVAARPGDLNGRYERGFVHLKKGDYDLAIADFDASLKINPQFDKAIRSRAEAVKAKENPAPKVAATNALPTTPDEEAAYCVEASYSYTQRLTKLVAQLRATRDKGQGLLSRPNLSPSDHAQLAGQLAALDTTIATNDAQRKDWETDLGVFTAYVQKNNLMANASLIAAMSGQVSKDQDAVGNGYQACIRACLLDKDCKATCNDSAQNSDASKRMLHCNEIAAQFK